MMRVLCSVYIYFMMLSVNLQMPDVMFSDFHQMSNIGPLIYFLWGHLEATVT